jgi:G3E family GTPase
MEKIPLVLLTGFLGSGKTTLLNGLLKTPELADSLVLINELGDIALDHDLVEATAANSVVLDHGCLCCTVRGALSGTLRSLFWQRQEKKIPSFQRIIIETTGLADPAPILHELLKHPTILHDYRLAGVVTCVDSMFVEQQLSQQPETLKQIAFADVLLITKSDLVSSEHLTSLQSRLRQLNPFANIHLTTGQVDPIVILENVVYNPLGKTLDAQRWLKSETFRPVQRQSGFSFRPNAKGEVKDVNRHDDHIRTTSITFDHPLSLRRLIDGLQIIASSGRENLLRMKGIVYVENEDEARAIHAVQDKIFPLTKLPNLRSASRQSKLIFIVRDMDTAWILNTITEYVGIENDSIRSGNIKQLEIH